MSTTAHLPDALARHPLEGVRVIDLGQLYNGPYAGFLLAMAGADVVKVEPPQGEALRARGGMTGLAYALGMLNSNKRDLAIDLKSDAGKQVFLELARGADVLLENFAPGVMDKLGLGCERLQAENPRLIYASSSGYGLSGPSMNNLAMDLTIQANSGIMSINGPADGPPLKAGLALCDFFGGVHLYAGIVTALYERELTGIGRQVEISMQEASYPALATNLTAMVSGGGAQPPRRGNRHPAAASAPYGVYETRDGHVAIICVREAHWHSLLEVIGREDVASDPRFCDQPTRGQHAEAVDELVNAWTRTEVKQTVVDRLAAKHVPCSLVRTLPEVYEDPHMHARGMLHRIDHPVFGEVNMPHSPLRFHGEDRLELRASPALGEHGAEVLTDWLGYDADAVARAIDEGAIVAPASVDPEPGPVAASSTAASPGTEPSR